MYMFLIRYVYSYNDIKYMYATAVTYTLLCKAIMQDQI